MKKILCSIVGFLATLFSLPSTAYAIGVAALIGTTMVATALFPAILYLYINYGGSGCWFCPLYTAAFDVINTIATQIYTQLAPIFLSLLAAGGALWIAWIVLKYFMTLNVPNTGELMTTLFKAIGRLVVGAAILMSSISFLFNYTVNPIIIFSGGLSNQILNSAGLSNGYVTEISRDGTRVSRTRYPLCTATDVNDSRFYTQDGQLKALSPQAYDTTLCMLKTMSLELIVGMAIGATYFVSAFTTNLIWYVLPNIECMLIGALIFIGFFFLYVLLPFKLVDIIVRVGFIIALTPLYVLFWVFPVTREYVKRGWDMLVTAMFTLVALSVLMVIAIRLMMAGIEPNTVLNALISGEIKKAVELMAFSGVRVFVTLVAAVMASKIVSMAPALGSAFGGASQSSTIGNAMAAQTAQFAKFVGKPAWRMAKSAYASHKAGSVGGQVASSIPTQGGGSTRGSGSPKPFGGSGGASGGGQNISVAGNVGGGSSPNISVGGMSGGGASGGGSSSGSGSGSANA